MAATIGLAGSCYSDPANFARERAAALLPSWQWACHVSDLPTSGTAVRVDFAGRSAFVLRGRDNTLRAFSNVCRHRGSRLLDGDLRTGLAFCVDAKVRCPYHGWVYDEQGTLIQESGEAPAAAQPDRRALPLQSLPVESWRGWVFVAFEAPSRPFASLVAPVEQELQYYPFEAVRRAAEPQLHSLRADWKAVGEHLLDIAHLERSRPGPKARIGRGHCVERRGDQVVAMTAKITSGADGSWSERAYARWLPRMEQFPEERRALWCRYYLWPNLALEITPDQVAVVRVLPDAAGESRLRTVTYAIPDGSREMHLARYLNARVRRRATMQDLRLLERRQAGLAVGDHAGGPLGDDEAGVQWFTGRLTDLLAQTAPRPVLTRRGPRPREAT